MADELAAMFAVLIIVGIVVVGVLIASVTASDTTIITVQNKSDDGMVILDTNGHFYTTSEGTYSQLHEGGTYEITTQGIAFGFVVPRIVKVSNCIDLSTNACYQRGIADDS
jgi:hypothetical protein